MSEETKPSKTSVAEAVRKMMRILEPLSPAERARVLDALTSVFEEAGNG